MKNQLLMMSTIAVVYATLVAPVQAQDYKNKIFSQRTGPDKCLGILAGTTDHPIMADCKNFTAEYWSVEKFGKGYTKFRNSLTAETQCLGLRTGTNTVKMADCNDNIPHQHWTVVPSNTAGYVRILNQAAGAENCLGIKESPDSSELDVNPCGTFFGQMWKIVQK